MPAAANSQNGLVAPWRAQPAIAIRRSQTVNNIPGQRTRRRSRNTRQANTVLASAAWEWLSKSRLSKFSAEEAARKRAAKTILPVCSLSSRRVCETHLLNQNVIEENFHVGRFS